jgi:hypothetical protein
VTDSRQRGANEASKRGQDGKSAFVPSGKESRDGCLTHVLPNVEVTGRRRMDALPARCNMDSGRRAGKVASRWRSG